MTPKAKFQSIILSLTTGIIILLWIAFGKSFEFPEVIIVLSGAFVSLTTYKLLYSLLNYIANQSRLFRMLILHKEFVEGTWVGFYIGMKGEVRFIIEEFKQDLDGLVIKGKGFNENKELHAKWISEISNINARTKKLRYMYEVSPINENMTGYGIADFDLEELNVIDIPQKITGFSSDNHWGKRIKSIEFKIKGKKTDREYLEIANRIYTENIHNY